MTGPSISFPDNFLWGAATAAYQIEGAAHADGRGPSIWDEFSHTPGNVANGDTGDVACDHYHRLDEDLDLMQRLGLPAYRFSISWSRVMPDGHGRVNRAGLDFYQRLVDGLLERNIAPLPTLFHWDLPMGLESIGGFRHRDIAKWFADYAALMVSELGDRVTQWATLNEPWVFAYLGHASGAHAPGLTDPPAAFRVAHHLLLAHGLATEAIRAERSGMACGIVLNPAPIRSVGDPELDDAALDRVDALRNRWWFDALLNGTYPGELLHDITGRDGLAELVRDGDLACISQPIDWIGINYYHDIGLHRGGDDVAVNHEYPTAGPVADPPTPEPHTDMGWPITPDGLTDLLTRLNRDYPNLPPLYITENGAAYDDPVSDGRVDDQRRIDYLDAHLRAVHRAIEGGVDVRGYLVWSLFDNFEWALGYDKRFGIVHIDFDTLERTPKDSAAWFSEVIARNGLTEGGDRLVAASRR